MAGKLCPRQVPVWMFCYDKKSWCVTLRPLWHKALSNLSRYTTTLWPKDLGIDCGKKYPEQRILNKIKRIYQIDIPAYKIGVYISISNKTRDDTLSVKAEHSSIMDAWPGRILNQCTRMLSAKYRTFCLGVDYKHASRVCAILGAFQKHLWALKSKSS